MLRMEMLENLQKTLQNFKINSLLGQEDVGQRRDAMRLKIENRARD